MTGVSFDFAGVLTGQPGQWLLSGFLMTIYVTVVGALLATLLAVLLLGLRIAPLAPARGLAIALVELFRNTPILVQFLFWYFAAYNLLPRSFRDYITAEHPWAVLPVGNVLLAPEFIAAAWGLGVFTAAFLAEELRAGLNAMPRGQKEAALSQGFGHWETLRFVLLPQALANSWQPLVTQYLNLMKLSSLASAISLAELTYQVRQVESYNAHAFEAFAVGTVLYLLLGLVLGQLLIVFGPKPVGARARRRAVKANRSATAAAIVGASGDA
ncbi:amino acid ABC transporter permease [Aquabacter cavernae]|uniref:amino acid ABC transporter permease n=1 Tax=Aquabacter cavernae TaxID=2496029 RepID=UPI000F8EAFAF|nr:amino acid ABC transporter permease [Aquabacter cavernae]